MALRMTSTPAATIATLATTPASPPVTSTAEAVAHAIPFSALPKGVRAIVLEIDVAESQLRRLADFGIRTGAAITALGQTAGESWVVAVNATRFAIDGTIARNLTVRPE